MQFNTSLPIHPGAGLGLGQPPQIDAASMDLSQSLGPVAGRGTIRVQFFYARIQISDDDAKTPGQWVNRLCVAKVIVGDPMTMPIRFITEAQAARDYPREWAMFQQYEQVPTDGTPLHELPGISQRQIALLAVNGVRSIEDLSDIDEHALSRIGFEAQHAQKIARKWLARRDENAATIDVAKAEATFEAQRKALERRLEAMEASNRALQAQLQMIQRVAPSGVQTVNLPQPGGGLMDAQPVDDPLEGMDVLDFDGPVAVTGLDDLTDPLQG